MINIKEIKYHAFSCCKFNLENYLKFLSDQDIPFSMQHYGYDFYILHDNCPVHKALIVQDFLNWFMPNQILAHPPYSFGFKSDGQFR